MLLLFLMLQIKDHLKDQGYYPFASILLGNKCDIESRVSDEEIKEFEKKYSIKYFPVSVVKDLNIKDALSYLENDYYQYIFEEKERLKSLIHYVDNNNNKKKCIIS